MTVAQAESTNVEARAQRSLGISSDTMYLMVAAELERRGFRTGTLADVGCGTGRLSAHLPETFDHVIGLDVLRYPDLVPRVEFRQVNLDGADWQIEAGFARVVVAIETIEHLENPRAFMRELTRCAAPGGLVIVTTPNQLSLLSKLTLVVKNEFNAFQESAGLYPAHLTALVESDLVKIARECGLESIAVTYSNQGRIPWTPYLWPSIFRGRAFSDNVLLSGIKPLKPLK